MGYDPDGPTVVAAYAPPPAPKKRSLKWLWITLAVVAALVILGGGGAVFALVQYAQPAAAAGTFCGDLKAQNYTAAYNLLSAKMQAAYNSAAFAQGNAALDGAEGKVTACGAGSGSNAYNYSLGGSTATLTATLKRETQGTLQGTIHLVNQNGWKVDGLDTALLGINLNALQTLGAYCAALESQNYTTAYGFLGGQLTTEVTSATTFGQLEQLQDQVDGKVTACAITAIATGNTDTSTTVTAMITRSTLGAKTGAITLTATNGAWKLTQVDDALQGTDLGPLLTGSIFIAAIQLGDYADAYKLLTPEVQAGLTLAAMEQFFTGVIPTVDQITSVTTDFHTYSVAGTAASYSGTITFTGPSNATQTRSFKISFTQEGGNWLVSDFEFL